MGGPTPGSKLGQLRGQTRVLRALSSLVLTASKERGCAALPGTWPGTSPSSPGRGFPSTRLAPLDTLCRARLRLLRGLLLARTTKPPGPTRTPHPWPHGLAWPGPGLTWPGLAQPRGPRQAPGHNSSPGQELQRAQAGPRRCPAGPPRPWGCSGTAEGLGEAGETGGRCLARRLLGSCVARLPRAAAKHRPSAQVQAGRFRLGKRSHVKEDGGRAGTGRGTSGAGGLQRPLAPHWLGRITWRG